MQLRELEVGSKVKLPGVKYKGKAVTFLVASKHKKNYSTLTDVYLISERVLASVERTRAGTEQANTENQTFLSEWSEYSKKLRLDLMVTPMISGTTTLSSRSLMTMALPNAEFLGLSGSLSAADKSRAQYENWNMRGNTEQLFADDQSRIALDMSGKAAEYWVSDKIRAELNKGYYVTTDGKLASGKYESAKSGYRPVIFLPGGCTVTGPAGGIYTVPEEEVFEFKGWQKESGDPDQVLDGDTAITSGILYRQSYRYTAIGYKSTTHYIDGERVGSGTIVWTFDGNIIAGTLFFPGLKPLSAGSHAVKIEAEGYSGNKVVKEATILVRSPKASFELNEPIESEKPASVAAIYIKGLCPEGMEWKVEACNNAFDDTPAWENVTAAVKSGAPVRLKNREKTADKWGYQVRVTLDRKGVNDTCGIQLLKTNFK